MFNWNYFGLAINFQSDNKLFDTLIRNKFDVFNHSNTHQFKKKKIKIVFKNEKTIELPDNRTILSSTTSKFENSLYIVHKYLTTESLIKTKFTSDNLVAEVHISFVSSFMFEVVNVLLLGSLKRQLFHILIKSYIEQSLLFALCTDNNLYCIHAASIERNGKVIIFAGMNGVGKSSLALQLSKEKNTNLYSDNYILVNNTHAFLFPDIIRLSKESISDLKLTPQTKFGFGKYIVAGEQLFSKKKTSRLETIYLVSRGNNWAKKKISSLTAIQMLEKMQIVNQEDVRYAPVSQFLTQKVQKKLDLKCQFQEIIIGPRNEQPYEF